MKRMLLSVLAVVATVGIVFLGFAYWYDTTGQHPDARYDTRVAQPAYVQTHPVVLVDATHNNFHTCAGRYQPFCVLLRSDGLEVKDLRQWSAAGLAGSSVLVIANAAGPDGYEEKNAFSDEDQQAIVGYVNGGGSLFLIADHSPFGSAAQELAGRFRVTMHYRYARDDDNKDGWDNERLLFSRANGLLRSHPITEGRTPEERVERVVTFTGQSLSGPPGSTAILVMGEKAYDWESRKVRFPAAGHAQVIAFEYGKGRVVVAGEAAFLTAQVDPLGLKFGMNSAGNDDRKFLLNALHWLTHTI
ncbi:MAG: DUF4350 domain-containing protein [Candidatus Koribacter versatilis]|uniref:DUF4350 domain-containing protein n=1 Tax=Candidatus Korobacter versatilis TaxID=658062 RepID=A0A932A8P9_9BACT|nr:DUF4350 domain-containing protein [Candidatus Koribacter versatilis]